MSNLNGKSVETEKSLSFFVFMTDCALNNTLQKFENKNYIHTLIDPDNEIKIHLPRFKLIFKSKDDGVFSKNFTGYKLGGDQFLGMLTTFRHYLILDAKDEFENQIVIIPDGKLDVDYEKSTKL
jgi:hypothetical protein